MADKPIVDKTIGDLTQAESIGGEDLFVLEQGGEAKKLKGARLVKYAQDSVSAQVTAATEAAESAETAKTGAESAQTQAQAARDAILNMIVEAITLEQGSPATVEKSLVDSVYKLIFGLPKGEKGATGPANTLTIGTVTSGTEVSATITGEAPNQVLNLVLKQGEKGNSGVYVGAGDMPEGYNVQIDPSGSGGGEIVTAENIQSALGYTPANSADLADKLPKSPANWEPWTSEEQAAALERLGIDEPYELIDSFTIDEESVSYVEREVEPDGTTYNFKKVMMRITSYNTNMSGLCRIVSCHTNGNNKFDNKYSAIYFNAGFNLTCVFCEKRNGFWLTEAVVSHTNGVTRSVYSEVDTLNTAYNLITGIRILFNKYFIVGTKIEIYGVRA